MKLYFFSVLHDVEKKDVKFFTALLTFGFLYRLMVVRWNAVQISSSI